MLFCTTEGEKNNTRSGNNEQHNYNLQIEEQMQNVEQVYNNKDVKERNSYDVLQKNQVATDRTTEISWQPFASCVQIENIGQTVFSPVPGEISF